MYRNEACGASGAISPDPGPTFRLTLIQRPSTTSCMVEKNSKQQLFSQTLVVSLAVGLVLLVVFSRMIILAALVGVGIGAICSPTLSFLRRKFRIPRVVGALLILLLLFLIFAILSLVTGQLVAEQLQNLSEKIPYLIERAEGWRDKLLNSYPSITRKFSEIEFAENVKAGAMRLIQGLGTGMSAVAGIALAFFIAIYTAINNDEYFKGWIKLFPKSKQLQVRDLSKKSAAVLRQWFAAQLIDMALVGVLTAVGLGVIGFRYWAVFGLMTALLTIVPYVGVLITFVLAALVTAADQPELFFWVVGVFFITQQVEGNLILPMVMKERVKLPEAPLLFMIVLMSYWFGLLGVLVAPGVLAIGRTLYFELTGETDPSPPEGQKMSLKAKAKELFSGKA